MPFWIPSTFPAPALSVMPFYVYLTDAAQVQALQAAFPDGLSGVAPATAAVTYSAPLGGTFSHGGAEAAQIQSLNWIGTDLPGLTGIPPGTFYVNNLFYAYDVNVTAGSAPSTDPDYAFAPAPYYWVGYFRHWNVEPAVVEIGQRRWIDGMELPNDGEGATDALAEQLSRDASRTPDGYGFAMRSTRNKVRSHDPVSYGASASRLSWEPLYIRLRRLPLANTNFWRCYGGNNSVSGAAMYITAGGAIEASNVSGAGALTSFGTSMALTLMQWYRLDIRVQFNPVAPVCPTPGTPTAGAFTLLINEADAILGTSSYTCAVAGQGIGATLLPHTRSTIGESFDVANVLELDIDDWINIAPTIVPTDPPPQQERFPTLLETCKDWEGHHIQRVGGTAFGATHNAAWSGDWRNLLQTPVRGADAATALTTATLNAIIDLATDYLDLQQGCPALVVGFFNQNGIAQTGLQVGYSLAGGGAVMTALGALGDGAWGSALYTPTGTTEPAPIYPLRILHANNAVAGGRTVKALGAAAEFLGNFGTVDVSPEGGGTLGPATTGVHNAPYDGTLWSQVVPLPLSPFTIQSGRYTGNALGQDITQPFPPHWWYVRELGGSTGGHRWWSSMLASHRGLLRGTVAGQMVQAVLTTLNTILMRIAGSNADNNASASTYQWIAVSDPGMRFLLNGAMSHKGTVSETQPLVDGTFTPEAGFFQDEVAGPNTGSKCWFKGIGHITNFASELINPETTGVVTFGAGSLGVLTPLFLDSSTAQTSYSLWRRLDGNPVTGTALDLVTWTGDGTGPRVIACDLQDRSPLLVLVCPHNGESWVRDPSHTGLSSSTASLNTTDNNHIIAGGLNSFTVATALNANGIVYDAFVLPGLPAAGAWSPNPPDPHVPIFPVPPQPAPGDQWYPDPPPPPPPNLDTATGVQTFASGTDSGGAAGCIAELSNGVDGGGVAACANADLSNGTDSGGEVCP